MNFKIAIPALLLILLGTTTASAETVTVQWDRNSESDVVGYLVSYGTMPGAVRAYTTTVDVGNQTSYTFTRTEGQEQVAYYFSVRARNSTGLVSSYATEVILNPLGGVPAPPGSSDFNGDGMIDLLWHHRGTGTLVTWFMNGARIIGSASLGQASDTNWKVVGTGDFNRDGFADLLWWHDLTGDFALWFMNGTRIVGSGSLSIARITDHSWEIKGIADMNRDGSVDIVWQHRTLGIATIWLMDGTTYIGDRVLVEGPVSDKNWRIAGIGDFNQDGHKDLVWQHDVTGLVTTWLMTDTTISGARDIYPTGSVSDPLWKIRSVIDLNGDTNPDLVWHHQGSGWIAIYLMNGTNVMQQISVTQASDVQWQIVGPR
jgi:VCBS repeat protein